MAHANPHEHADHGHHADDANSPAALDRTPRVASSSSMWVALLLIGLFVAAVNFVSVSSHSAHEGGHTKEAAVHPNKEATSNQTLSGENGTGRPTHTETGTPAGGHDGGAAGHAEGADHAEGH